MIGEIQEESGAKAMRPLTLEEELTAMLADSESWDIGSFRSAIKHLLARGRWRADHTSRPESPVWRRFVPRVSKVWAVVHPTEKRVIAVDDQGQASVFTIEEFKTVFRSETEE